eukprot:GGOE01049308.1.p1 GENE.GGOE01049308.1~~GGOE01049308.1.p1  ORF type:complete len:263 (+),score=82.51 GGOE01049308.1:50-838(+)
MRTLCLVTGASKGYGRALATVFARAVPECDFCLLSRADMGEAMAEVKRHLTAGCSVRTFTLDLSQVDRLEDAFAGILAQYTPGAYSRAFVLHNAGSLGPLCPLADLQHVDLQPVLALNLTAFLLLTSSFLRHFPASTGCEVSIINISSLLALVPMEGLGIYCMVKAARDMAIKVLAKEAPPHMKYLSYAPGPMPTAMFDEIRTSVQHPMTQAAFEKMSHETLVDPHSSATCLARYLTLGCFASGAHVDFFDEHPFSETDAKL